MREKLIELLKMAMDYSYVLRELKSTTTDADEDPFIAMADHLIANGVIVMPCKIGETVYIIRDCTCCVGPDEYKGTKCGNKVYMGKDRRNHHCGYVSEVKFAVKHIADFGKKVFLTQEEARSELAKMARERKNNGQ